ncbi:nucleoside hydrolase, partial [Enterococcus faecium]|uniref:nucleoside hydrolase n=1 Tax=Enterococcus faecium TaxID=1352 RepID=UPI0030C8720C
HDGTAEWNVFWDPEAAGRVWNSSIKIDLVALESTNQVPLTVDIRNSWAAERKYLGLDFIGQCYACCPPLVHFTTHSTYFLWDVLTTAFVGNPDLVNTNTNNIIVHTHGPIQGRTEETADCRPVNVVYDVNRDAFFNYITNFAKKA